MVLEIDSLIGASRELLRLAKKWNPNFSEKLKILEDDSIDEAYKAVLLSLVARTQQNAQNGRRKKKSHTNNKGKKMKDRSKHTGLNRDPDYELFSKHFKKRDNSFRLQYGKGGPVVVVQYEGDIESEKERRREVSNALVVVHEKIPENQAPRRLTRGYLRKYGQLDQVHGVENQYKNNPQPVLVKNTSNINKVVRVDGPRSVDMPKGWRVVNEKILEKQDWSIGGFKREYGTSDQMDGVGNQHKRDSQSILVKKKSITDMVECIGGPRNVVMHKGMTVVTEVIPEKQDRRMLTRSLKRKNGPSDQMHGAENQHKHVKHIDAPRDVSVHKGQTKVNGKINLQRQEIGAKLPRAAKTENGISNQMPWVEIQQSTSFKGTNSPTCGKSRNETNREMNLVGRRNVRTMGFENTSGVNDRKKQTVRNFNETREVKIELPNETPRLENYHEPDLQPASSEKTKSLDPIKLMNEAKNVQNERRSAIEFREAKPEECFMEYDEDKSDSEVVILDEAACFKKGALNPFVPSKRFDISTQEDGILLNGGSSETNVFRKEVLDDLNKPYDREEYKRLAKEVKNRRYLESHPDLGGKFKLEKYKFNRRRRLALLRGFFFWLQNLTREGSFKPWKDRACLAVEPPYP